MFEPESEELLHKIANCIPKRISVYSWDDSYKNYGKITMDSKDINLGVLTLKQFIEKKPSLKYAPWKPTHHELDTFLRWKSTKSDFSDLKHKYDKKKFQSIFKFKKNIANPTVSADLKKRKMEKQMEINKIEKELIDICNNRQHTDKPIRSSYKYIVQILDKYLNNLIKEYTQWVYNMQKHNQLS